MSQNGRERVNEERAEEQAVAKVKAAPIHYTDLNKTITQFEESVIAYVKESCRTLRKQSTALGKLVPRSKYEGKKNPRDTKPMAITPALQDLLGLPKPELQHSHFLTEMNRYAKANGLKLEDPQRRFIRVNEAMLRTFDLENLRHNYRKKVKDEDGNVHEEIDNRLVMQTIPRCLGPRKNADGEVVKENGKTVYDFDENDRIRVVTNTDFPILTSQHIVRKN